MKFISPRFTLIAGAVSLSFIAAALAGPSRSPVVGVPKIQGREIEQFVLMDFVRVNPATNAGMSTTAYVMIPGQFVPASEDGGGVYYQAVNGFRRAHEPTQVAPGGVYVSRTGKYSMTAYLGDARDQGAAVNLLNHRPMIVDDMKKFQVAKSTSAKAPKK